MELLSEQFHSEVSLARPPTTDGVTECKNAIELRIEERCLRSPFVKVSPFAVSLPLQSMVVRGAISDFHIGNSSLQSVFARFRGQLNNY
jgi:hypothetical protein